MPIVVKVLFVLWEAQLQIKGKLDVYYNNAWRIVCDDGFDASDAKVMCQQFEYRGYVSDINTEGMDQT